MRLMQVEDRLNADIYARWGIDGQTLHEQSVADEGAARFAFGHRTIERVSEHQVGVYPPAWSTDPDRSEVVLVPRSSIARVQDDTENVSVHVARDGEVAVGLVTLSGEYVADPDLASVAEALRVDEGTAHATVLETGRQLQRGQAALIGDEPMPADTIPVRWEPSAVPGQDRSVQPEVAPEEYLRGLIDPDGAARSLAREARDRHDIAAATFNEERIQAVADGRVGVMLVRFGEALDDASVDLTNWTHDGGTVQVHVDADNRVRADVTGPNSSTDADLPAVAAALGINEADASQAVMEAAHQLQRGQVAYEASSDTDADERVEAFDQGSGQQAREALAWGRAPTQTAGDDLDRWSERMQRRAGGPSPDAEPLSAEFKRAELSRHQMPLAEAMQFGVAGNGPEQNAQRARNAQAVVDEYQRSDARANEFRPVAAELVAANNGDLEAAVNDSEFRKAVVNHEELPGGFAVINDDGGEDYIDPDAKYEAGLAEQHRAAVLDGTPIRDGRDADTPDEVENTGRTREQEQPMTQQPNEMTTSDGPDVGDDHEPSPERARQEAANEACNPDVVQAASGGRVDVLEPGWNSPGLSEMTLTRHVDIPEQGSVTVPSTPEVSVYVDADEQVHATIHDRGEEVRDATPAQVAEALDLDEGTAQQTVMEAAHELQRGQVAYDAPDGEVDAAVESFDRDHEYQTNDSLSWATNTTARVEEQSVGQEAEPDVDEMVNMGMADDRAVARQGQDRGDFRRQQVDMQQVQDRIASLDGVGAGHPADGYDRSQELSQDRGMRM